MMRTTLLILITLSLVLAVDSARATPLRLRHSSKRTVSTSPPNQPRVLVDRQGEPLLKPFWLDHALEGTPHIEVNLSKQVARVYYGDKLVGQSPICAGRPGFRTPTGEFKVISKRKNHNSNLYGSWVDSTGAYAGEASASDTPPNGMTYVPAPMPYFMRLTYGGVGFHEGVIQGYPASHGCLRLPKEMAAKFFEHIPKNTKVIILDSEKPNPEAIDE